MPSIGKMRYKVKLQSPGRTADSGGGAAIAWTTLVELYADIKPVSGRETYSQGQIQDSVTHEVTVRYRVGLNTTYRLLYESRIFNIRYVKNVDERDRWMVLTCEEGVGV